MSAPIDVLSVLQRQIDLALSHDNDERAEALQDIRVAVAELIEAAEWMSSYFHAESGVGRVIRLRNALARVGGAK